MAGAGERIMSVQGLTGSADFIRAWVEARLAGTAFQLFRPQAIDFGQRFQRKTETRTSRSICNWMKPVILLARLTNKNRD
jgi:hypothetical protein